MAMAYYSDSHFMNPEADDLQAAWSMPPDPHGQQNRELAAQYGYVPLEVARSQGQQMSSSSHGMMYATPAPPFTYAANAQGQSSGPAYDPNAYHSTVQSAAGFQHHYGMVQPGFQHSNYAATMGDHGVLTPEQFSQYDNNQPHVEQSNQSEFLQGIGQGYQHTNGFEGRRLWSGSAQHEDEDMTSDRESINQDYSGQDVASFNVDGGRRDFDGEHSGYANDSDVFGGGRDIDEEYSHQYADDEDNFSEDEDDAYGVADDDGYSGGYEDGSSQSDGASERNEDVGGYRPRSTSPNRSYGGSRSSRSWESSESLPSIHGILNRSHTQTSPVSEARTPAGDPRFESHHQQAMNTDRGSSSNMVHNWMRSSDPGGAPGRHDGTHPLLHSPSRQQDFQLSTPFTRQMASGPGRNVNGVPSRLFSTPGSSSLAVIKEGRKRFGSPLSAASKTDGRSKHISKKYKQVADSAFASPSSRFQPSVIETRSHSGGSGSHLAGPSRDVPFHAGPSVVGPTGPLGSENPYAVPASRGEITEIRRILDGLIGAVRELSATCTRLASVHEPQAGSTGPAGRNMPPPPPPPQVPSERFEAKRKGAPVRRSDDALTLSANVQEYARILLKRETADSPFDSTTLATPREVKRWKNSKKGEFCCTEDNFRIDITSGALNDWNRSAAVVFADAFINSGDYECEDADLVADAFVTHLRTLRKKFRERDRTVGEVQDSQKKARRDQRKDKLFHRRRRTALQNPELAPHLSMLETFGVDGMSSDESVRENGEVRYGILKKSWRPEEVTLWLAGFDAVDAITRGKRGRQPHKRVVSTKLDDSRAPVRGLPKNAYNSTWYATIGPFDRTKLRRAETGYSFKHCDAVQVVLNEYTRQINNPAQYR